MICWSCYAGYIPYLLVILFTWLVSLWKGKTVAPKEEEKKEAKMDMNEKKMDMNEKKTNEKDIKRALDDLDE